MAPGCSCRIMSFVSRSGKGALPLKHSLVFSPFTLYFKDRLCVYHCHSPCVFFSNGSTAPWGPRPPHFSRLHDHTLFRHTTLVRTSSSQRPLPDNTQHSQETDIYALGGIRTHNLSKSAAVDPRLRPRGHWDRP
jgi:hypothetical protein